MPVDASGQTDTHFFPLYPLSVARGAAFIVGDVYVAGLLVSNTAFVLAGMILFALVRDQFDEATARRTIIFCPEAFSPSPTASSAMYTESLFLLACVGAFYWASSPLVAQRRLMCRGGGGDTPGRIVHGRRAGDDDNLAARRPPRISPAANRLGHSCLHRSCRVGLLSRLSIWPSADFLHLAKCQRVGRRQFVRGFWPSAACLVHVFVQRFRRRAIADESVDASDHRDLRLRLRCRLVQIAAQLLALWTVLILAICFWSTAGYGPYVATTFPLFITAAILLKDQRIYHGVVYICVLLLALLTILFVRSYWVA